MVRRLGFIVIAALTGLGLSCSAAPAPPAPQPSPAPAAPPPAAPTVLNPTVSINEVMVDVIDHAGHNLWQAERKGKAPKTDQDWDNIEEHAVQLLSAATVITVGGTGPNDKVWVNTPSWREHAKKLSDAAAEAMNAGQNKKFDALVAANGKIVDACEGCHKEFKPNLPSEGITHRHVD
jgi:hypothetical protein